MENTPPSPDDQIAALDTVLIVLRALVEAAYEVLGPVEDPLQADAKYRAVRNLLIRTLRAPPRRNPRRRKRRTRHF